MHHHINTLFHGLLKELPRSIFEKFVKKHKADKWRKSFDSWSHLVSMVFCQLSKRHSLRDLERSLNSNNNSLYHLGIKAIKRSNLSYSNNTRNVEVFTEAFNHLLRKANNSLGTVAQEITYLIDSTTISLNKNNFAWAEFRKNKSGVKMHLVYEYTSKLPVYFEITKANRSDLKQAEGFVIEPNATYVFDKAYTKYSWWNELNNASCIFVTRMKKEAVYKVLSNSELKDNRVISDEVIELTERRGKQYKGTLRRIVFHDKGKELTFVTNDLISEATRVTELYKKRWEIELFFKWIKQNLKIKKFIGTSENAIKIQIITAMIAYLLVRLSHRNYGIGISLQSFAQLLQIILFRKEPICQILAPPKTYKSSEHSKQLTFNLFGQ